MGCMPLGIWTKVFVASDGVLESTYIHRYVYLVISPELNPRMLSRQQRITVAGEDDC